MRVVFMGTPEFAVPSLVGLAERHEIVSAYTRADAVRGRGSKTSPSPVKTKALELGVEIREPSTLRDPTEWEHLRALAPEMIVVAAYGFILPPEVLEIPRFGVVNVHASLLPRWRGAAPIQRAILAGDPVTGVSIMRMEEGLDTGPFCTVAEVPIGDSDSTELTRRLAEAGASALLDALDRIADGACEWTEQPPDGVTYADKVSKRDVALSPELDGATLLRRIRASSPAAPARAAIDGRGVTVLAAAETGEPCPSTGAIAPVKAGLVLGASGSCVLVTRLKPDGKGPMRAADWARGAHLGADSRWDSE